MAMPLVFSPVTLWNYRDACPVAGVKLGVPSRAAESRYIHLLDGGLADNTGVQNSLELISVRGGIVEVARSLSLQGVRKHVYIIVNAQVQRKLKDDTMPDTPGLGRQLRSMMDIPIDRYSESSIEELRREVLRWRAQLYFASDQQLGGIVERDADFYVVEVSLVAPPAGVAAPVLSETWTSLRISKDDSAALRRYAREALAASSEWQRLLHDLADGPQISASVQPR